MTDAINGTNGHHHPAADQEGEAITARPIAELEKPRVLPCSKRLQGAHGWCVKDDGHSGDCDGVKSASPPRTVYAAGRKRPASTAPPIASTGPRPVPTMQEIAQTVARAQKGLVEAERDISLALTMLRASAKVAT